MSIGLWRILGFGFRGGDWFLGVFFGCGLGGGVFLRLHWCCLGLRGVACVGLSGLALSGREKRWGLKIQSRKRCFSVVFVLLGPLFFEIR